MTSFFGSGMSINVDLKAFERRKRLPRCSEGKNERNCTLKMKKSYSGLKKVGIQCCYY